MMALVSAMAARVGESVFARWCGTVGDVLDVAIPIVLFVTVVAALGSVVFGLVH